MSGRTEVSRGGISEPEILGYGIVGSIVAWCDTLGGAGTLDDGFADLARSLGADAAMLVRTDLRDNRPVRLATADFAPHGGGARPLQRAFAESYFGGPFLHARAGTIWTGTGHADYSSGDPALPEWQDSRRMKEFVVLVLGAEGGKRDHVELHFRNLLSPAEEAMLEALLPDLVRFWARRRVGLVSRTLVDQRVRDLRPKAPAVQAHLLSVENPAQLSRAEFRVCLLLSRGLLVQAVAQELGLSEPTVRTHLRNIYAKTGTSCLAELVFRLMDSRPSPGLQARIA